MLTHQGIPLRRIQPAKRAMFLVERWDGPIMYLHMDSIGSDGGFDEIIQTAYHHAAHILPKPASEDVPDQATFFCS